AGPIRRARRDRATPSAKRSVSTDPFERVTAEDLESRCAGEGPPEPGAAAGVVYAAILPGPAVPAAARRWAETGRSRRAWRGRGGRCRSATRGRGRRVVWLGAGWGSRMTRLPRPEVRKFQPQ